MLKQPQEHILHVEGLVWTGAEGSQSGHFLPPLLGCSRPWDPREPRQGRAREQAVPHSSPSLGSSEEGRGGHTHWHMEKPPRCRTHTGAPFKKKNKDTPDCWVQNQLVFTEASTEPWVLQLGRRLAG